MRHKTYLVVRQGKVLHCTRKFANAKAFLRGLDLPDAEIRRRVRRPSAGELCGAGAMPAEYAKLPVLTRQEFDSLPKESQLRYVRVDAEPEIERVQSMIDCVPESEDDILEIIGPDEFPELLSSDGAARVRPKTDAELYAAELRILFEPAKIDARDGKFFVNLASKLREFAAELEHAALQVEAAAVAFEGMEMANAL